MKPTWTPRVGFKPRNMDVLMNAQSPHKCCFTLKSAVFGLSSSLLPLVSGGVGLFCEWVGKADLLSDQFDGKQSGESVDLPLTCHPFRRLTNFAFRSSEVRCLLLDLDPYGYFHNIDIVQGVQCKKGVAVKCKVFYGQEPPSGGIYYPRMWGHLSTTWSNLLK